MHFNFSGKVGFFNPPDIFSFFYDCLHHRVHVFFILIFMLLCSQQLAAFTQAGMVLFFENNLEKNIINEGVVMAVASDAANKNNYKINDYKLFGHGDTQVDYSNKMQLPIKSRLNVQVKGIVASSVENKSIVIISRNGLQHSVQIGEFIEDTDARVNKILSDHIIIIRQQRQEILWLNGESEIKKPTISIEYARGANEEVISNSTALLDCLSVSPVKENNILKGYHINSNKKLCLFERSGLRANDLVVAINGINLQNEHDTIAVINKIKNLTEINLTVLRDGTRQDIYVDLSKFKLAESQPE